MRRNRQQQKEEHGRIGKVGQLNRATHQNCDCAKNLCEHQNGNKVQRSPECGLCRVDHIPLSRIEGSSSKVHKSNQAG